MDAKLVVVLVLISALNLTTAQRVSLPVQRFALPENFFPRDNADPSIILGERAQEGEFPFQAYIRSTRFFGFISASCGGSLIRDTWVLTAAHCIDGMWESEVRLGGTNINNMSYVMTADLLLMHENYNSQTLENDVALLRLPSPATGTNIAPIALAQPSVGTLVNETVTASGYGRTNNTGGISPDLMRVDLVGISNEECMEAYGNIIVNSTLCASWDRGTGQSGQSTCSGDSGGPLNYNGPDGQVLVGVVSFVSSRGCDSGAPSGYARVSSFVDWIETNINANSPNSTRL